MKLPLQWRNPPSNAKIQRDFSLGGWYSHYFYYFLLTIPSNSTEGKKPVYYSLFWLGHRNFSSVQFSHSVMSDSLQPHEPQHARPPCPSPTPGVHPNSCQLSQWCHPTISSSVLPSAAFNLSQYQGLFKWVSSSHQVAKVLEFQLQHQSFQWTPSTDLL